eukprot:5846311-Alexandrium_andersonii.AAC.1
MRANAVLGPPNLHPSSLVCAVTRAIVDTGLDVVPHDLIRYPAMRCDRLRPTTNAHRTTPM